MLSNFTNNRRLIRKSFIRKNSVDRNPLYHLIKNQTIRIEALRVLTIPLGRTWKALKHNLPTDGDSLPLPRDLFSKNIQCKYFCARQLSAED